MNEEIAKLSGMAYHGGYYTAQEWELKTGVNPARFPEYFTATRHGAYFVTDKFRQEYNQWTNARRRDMDMLLGRIEY